MWCNSVLSLLGLLCQRAAAATDAPTGPTGREIGWWGSPGGDDPAVIGVWRGSRRWAACVLAVCLLGLGTPTDGRTSSVIAKTDDDFTPAAVYDAEHFLDHHVRMLATVDGRHDDTARLRAIEAPPLMPSLGSPAERLLRAHNSPARAVQQRYSRAPGIYPPLPPPCACENRSLCGPLGPEWPAFGARKEVIASFYPMMDVCKPPPAPAPTSLP